MRWQTLYRKYGAYFVTALTAVVVVVLSYFVIKPRVADIFLLRQELSGQQERSQRLDTKQKEIVNLALEEAELNDQLREIDLALPYHKDVASLVFGVQKLAQEASVSAKSIQLSPGLLTTAATGVLTRAGELNIKATFEGTMDGVRLLLTKLAAARRLLVPQSVSISTHARAEELVDITIPLVAYYLPSPKELGDVTTPLPKLSPSDKELIDKISQFNVYTGLAVPVISPQATGSAQVDIFRRSQ